MVEDTLTAATVITTLATELHICQITNMIANYYWTGLPR